MPPTTTKRNPSDLGYIEDRWYCNDGKTPKGRHGEGKRYKARWTDEDGRERGASFASERAAKQHLKSVARGEYGEYHLEADVQAVLRSVVTHSGVGTGHGQRFDQAIGSVTFGDVQLNRLRPTRFSVDQGNGR